MEAELKSEMAACAYNLGTRKAETGRPRVQGQCGQHGEFKASLGFVRLPQNKER